MPILSVFALLLKSRFFGFYVNGVTLADEKPPSDEGGGFCEAKDGGREISPPVTAYAVPAPSS